MAEIRIERRPSSTWAWIVAAIIILALVLAYVYLWNPSSIGALPRLQR